MNNDKKDSLIHYLTKQIHELPIIIDEELSYKKKKFNPRDDFNNLTNLIDDFLNGKNINRYIVLPVLEVPGKQQFYIKFMIICKKQKTLILIIFYIFPAIISIK